ncbi:hypothetical protein Scep_021181 [Stephania cephalantha]|uniref:Uncharacterized protein n=1 Tax=Stephania cephalantha TaxID=152367 RepID=A0AAP0I009_9MAGN
MAAASSTVALADDEGDDWELCNDDGFIYKRRKRSHPDHPTSSGADGAPAEREAEHRRRRRDHKRRFLAALRERYEREIAQWERLSTTLQEIEERAETHRSHHQLQEEQQRPAEVAEVDEAAAAVLDLGSACAVVDELVLQAEAQEVIIRDMSNLCDVAEAMCEAEEERLKQPLFDLPVWSSPRSLMDALCDQDLCSSDDNALQVT